METQIKRGDIGARMKHLIYELGLNNSSFAKSIGVTPPSITSIVKGDSKPRYELIEKILTAYPTLSRAWLMEGIEPVFIGSPPPTTSKYEESKYLLEYLQKIEESFKQEYNKLLEDKDKLISSQQAFIQTLIGQLGSLGKLDLSEEILPVQTQCDILSMSKGFASPAKIITMPTYQNVA
jgi:transcriptional regulator with XRE-family HTH domain